MCVCVYIYIYIHTQIHACMHTQVRHMLVRHRGSGMTSYLSSSLKDGEKNYVCMYVSGWIIPFLPQEEHEKFHVCMYECVYDVQRNM
jgi:hypothetical protein